MKHSYDFRADTSVLKEISEIAAEASRKAGFNDSEAGSIILAVNEACTNTITHGLQKDPTKKFQFEVEWNKNEIVFLIHERGISFNPSQVKVPDLEAPLEERPIGGLGVYFVQKLMDEVNYWTDEDGLKTLRMVKRKAPLTT